METRQQGKLTEAERLILTGASLHTLVKRGTELPDTVSFAAAYTVLGVGRTRAYEAVRCGQFPCRVIRIGKTIRVPIAEIANTLGMDISSVSTGQEEIQ